MLEAVYTMDCNCKLTCGVVAVVSIVVVGVVIKKLRKKPKDVDYPKNTVILHQIGRGPWAPSMTPFAVKLETYLRMAKIPCQNVHSYIPSSKGKFPWMSYNGEDIADSALCIKFLNKKLGVDLNSHLSPSERGVAQSMQTMMEDHAYWCLVLYRWIFDNDKSVLMDKVFKISWLFKKMIIRNVTKQTHAQGMGRHTEAEVEQFLKDDLQALSDFLGNKKYLFGNQACEADCAVFGQLAQLYWQFMGTGLGTLIKDKHPNIARYCENMKSTYWPDWDDCITHGCTREATH